ncbi:hypothetical protein BMS3Abin04_01480 [bacterium BMS3Abin04]|nr:hypothetical protein BMS3Abin04_01480 [bacterium BMS3Abin04]
MVISFELVHALKILEAVEVDEIEEPDFIFNPNGTHSTLSVRLIFKFNGDPTFELSFIAVPVPSLK